MTCKTVGVFSQLQYRISTHLMIGTLPYVTLGEFWCFFCVGRVCVLKLVDEWFYSVQMAGKGMLIERQVQIQY